MSILVPNQQFMSEEVKIPFEKDLPQVSATINQHIENFGSLGKRLEIGARAKVSINKPGFSLTHYEPTVDVLIGIGKDHVARLIMDVGAWEALKNGEEIDIDTLASFRNNFL